MDGWGDVCVRVFVFLWNIGGLDGVMTRRKEEQRYRWMTYVRVVIGICSASYPAYCHVMSDPYNMQYVRSKYIDTQVSPMIREYMRLGKSRDH